MKQPPKEKVYEAFSAIADGRVNMKEDHAEVTSSNGDKTYEVQWRDNMAASSDPATYWQGYPGYPLIRRIVQLCLIQPAFHGRS